jgi:hypothetical protein
VLPTARSQTSPSTSGRDSLSSRGALIASSLCGKTKVENAISGNTYEEVGRHLRRPAPPRPHGVSDDGTFWVPHPMCDWKRSDWLISLSFVYHRTEIQSRLRGTRCSSSTTAPRTKCGGTGRKEIPRRGSRISAGRTRKIPLLCSRNSPARWHSQNVRHADAGDTRRHARPADG